LTFVFSETKNMNDIWWNQDA